MSLKICVSLLLSLTLAQVAFAKRLPPPVVKPVTVDGIEYRTATNRNLKGPGPGLHASVGAFDTKTGKALWSVTLYEIRYKPNLETDVQDVYPAQMTLNGRVLEVTDENGLRYRVNIDKQTVVVTKPKP